MATSNDREPYGINRREQAALRWLDEHPEQLARCERMTDHAWCDWIANFELPEESEETEICLEK